MGFVKKACSTVQYRLIWSRVSRYKVIARKQDVAPLPLLVLPGIPRDYPFTWSGPCCLGQEIFMAQGLGFSLKKPTYFPIFFVKQVKLFKEPMIFKSTLPKTIHSTRALRGSLPCEWIAV